MALRLKIIVISTRKLDFDVTNTQIRAHHILQNTQNHLQKRLFTAFPFIFYGFHLRLGTFPAVSHDDSTTGIACGTATVSVRKTTDRQHRLVEVSALSLRLCAVAITILSPRELKNS